MFLIPQTLRTNTAKRQVLSSAQLIIFAITTSKILAATSAALKKNNFSTKNAADCVQEFLDVVVTFNRKNTLLTVILTAQMYQKNELIFFNPWKLEGFLIQNHHVPQNLFILMRKSTSSGVNLNQVYQGAGFLFLQISFSRREQNHV